MNELETLKQYALDNYDLGGHWIFETFSNSDYAQVLAESQSLEAAKKAIREDWELTQEREQECRW